MERCYTDGALGMGSLGQCNAKPRHAQTTRGGKYFENEKREATALLFQPCRMHRPEPVKKRQACCAGVICRARRRQLFQLSPRGTITLLTFPSGRTHSSG